MKFLTAAGIVATTSFIMSLDANAQECSASKKQCSGSNASYAAMSKDIVDTAVSAGSFNTLVAAVKAAGLVETLKSDGPFTVFAPSDDAFKNLPAGTVEKLLLPENKQQLIDVLTYHVVPGRVLAADVVNLKAADSVNGQRLGIRVENGKVMVAKANVVKTDIECSNGVIHVIDQVMLPNNKNIVEVAASNDNFSTLVAAVKAAGLVDVLAGEGPFTVFAPTNAAFEKLPEGTVANLLKPENKHQLIDILKFHVVAGRVYSDQALKAGHAKTLSGDTLKIRIDDNKKAMVGDAELVKLDLDTNNGVIHVIDTVLIPVRSE